MLALIDFLDVSRCKASTLSNSKFILKLHRTIFFLHLLMCADVEEEIGELGGRVLGSVRRREARHQHHRLPGEIVLALPEEGHAVVGYQIRIVVLVVLEAVLYLLAVHVDAVVVVARIHY